MGTWGTNVEDDDAFEEALELVRQLSLGGMTNEEIESTLREKYKDSPVRHIAILGVIYGLWEIGAITPKHKAEVHSILFDGTDEGYWDELCPSDELKRSRRRAVVRFEKKLEKIPPKKKIRKNTNPTEPEKGEVFWYRDKGVIYGAVILEMQGKYTLVALTERLEVEPTKIEEIYDAPFYTAAWFFGILPDRRRHKIGQLILEDDYSNSAGLYIFDRDIGDVLKSSVYDHNPGGKYHWNHTFRQLILENYSIRGVIENRRITKTDEKEVIRSMSDRTPRW